MDWREGVGYRYIVPASPYVGGVKYVDAAPSSAFMTHPHRHVALHLAAWLGMLVLAVLNGALREALLTPNLGDTVGRQLSTLSLLALFSGWFSKPWPAVFEDYDALAGRVWILVPLWTLVGPYVCFRAFERRRRSR